MRLRRLHDRRDNGTSIVQNGDSGSPVYTSPDGATATIRGLVVAGNGTTTPPADRIKTYGAV